MGRFFMWYIYVLYSVTGEKTYTGYTNNIERRLIEHNFTESKGFTLRYRPWTLIRKELYESKAEAMEREKFLKTGRGRDEIKNFVRDFLQNGAVSAAADRLTPRRISAITINIGGRFFIALPFYTAP